MKFKAPVSIDTALRIYYQYPEIGNKEIKELLGMSSSKSLDRYKKAVRERQFERGVLTSQAFTVNTEVAYEVWGIDVVDLERRRDKLRALGLSAVNE